jgi:hypothetical protein
VRTETYPQRGFGSVRLFSRAYRPAHDSPSRLALLEGYVRCSARRREVPAGQLGLTVAMEQERTLSLMTTGAAPGFPGSRPGPEAGGHLARYGDARGRVALRAR